MSKTTKRLAVWVGALQFAVQGIAGVGFLAVHSTDAVAANGQCKWENGPGAGGEYAYCKAEDCIGAGGLAQCSAGMPAAATGVDDARVGPDKWTYVACDWAGASLPLIVRWCEAAGGTWIGSTHQCENLPPGMLGPSSSNTEALIVQTSDTFMNERASENCTVELESETEWGTPTTSQVCWGTGSVAYSLGLPFQYQRSRTYYSSCEDRRLPIVLMKNRGVKCPTGYKLRNSPIRGQECYKPPAECCTIANPVSPINGAKTQDEVDYAPAVQGGLRFSRYYRSTGYYRPTVISAGANSPNIEQRDYWRHSYDKRLRVVTGNAEVTAILENADGTVISFDASGQEMANLNGAAARLQSAPNGMWDVVQANSDVERYDAAGQLVSITTRAGMVTSLAYDTGRLVTVTGQFGHALTLGYDSDGRLSTLTLPDNSVIEYEYDSYNRPITVTYPDSTTRTYHYENAVYNWALTGITDESNQRFATYGYDTSGRATLSEHAGGVSRYQFVYGTSSTTITDPLGRETVFTPSVAGGVQRRSGYASPCLDCGKFRTVTYDANGNVSSRIDFNNNQTIYEYDLQRNLESSRTEAHGSPLARTITTQWHPIFRLPEQIDEPGRRTNYTYDTSGNPLTTTTTDLATSNTRTVTYTYNSVGQVLTVDGSRSDVTDEATNTYNICSYGSECGQLATQTNALGHTTIYSTYNQHGQPLTIVDANGLTTTFTYDARQRVLSRDVGGEVTSFTYYPTGLLKRVTTPGGSYLEYSYDAAHRLTSVADGEGNRITYTLNNAGQRTIESVYDPSQVLARTRGWVYDTVGRLLSEVDAYNNSTAFTYDLNGNKDGSIDPESRPTAYSYDALDRLASMTDPIGGVVEYTYTDRDEIETVKDPRNVTTAYEYNGFGDLTKQISPDTGITQFSRDATGNLHVSTDARGETATYTYDALNRPTQVLYDDQTISFVYDQGTNGKGRLTQMTDSSGSTQWNYSQHGRVTGKQQTVAGTSLSIAYGYNTDGQLQQITTPSGQAVTFTYSNGLVSGISVNGSPLLSNVLYAPFASPRGWNWANGTIAVREQDLNGRVTTIDSSGLSTYGFNADGTIQSIADDSSAMPFATGLTEFTVDPNSNRLVSGAGVDPRSYSYDLAGNVLNDGVRSMAYNAAGRMISASGPSGSATYLLNGLGQRVRKMVGTSSRLFFYDEAGHLLGEYDQSGALIQETVWLGDLPVATLRPNGPSGVAVFYVHADHLGTPRKISRPSDNQIVWRWDADPFGAAPASEDPDGDGAAFVYALRFPGQYHDAESGLNYNYYRDGYDPTTGRYTQSDPIGLGGGLNTYLYVDANPMLEADPSGLVPGPNTRKINCNKEDSQKCQAEFQSKGEEYRGCKYVEVWRIRSITNGERWAPVEYDWKRINTECRCLEKTAAKCMAAAAIVIYYIVSEGSRIVFPPRNLVPVP